MKRFLLLSLTAAMLGCSSSKAPQATDRSQHDAAKHAGHEAHSESAMLMVQTDPPAPVAGKPVGLKMMIHEADGAMAREFETVHEKLVHLIIVRDGLDEFAHVHPAVDEQGNLMITHTFAKAGKYRLFADHKPKGKSPAVAKAEIEVSGEPSTRSALTVNAPGKVTADGVVAQIELQNAKAGQSSEVRFRLTNESGQAIDDLQPYLGARGHLVVISAEGTQYVHAHPMDAPTAANEVVFISDFPASGLYKGWAQFQVKDRVRTVPFVAEIH
jgi:hypothetical protein